MGAAAHDGLRNSHYAVPDSSRSQITAPECSIPDLGYYTKWMFIEALPLAAITLFALGHVALLLYKKCILCRSGKTTGHVNVMVRRRPCPHE